MSATPITSATRYYRRDVTKVYWVPTIADKNAPTRAELDAGTDLSLEVGDMSGWQVKANVIETPSLGSQFDAKINGSITADDSSLTMYQSQDGTDARTLFPRGTNGFVVWMDEGDAVGNLMDVFPVRVLSAGKMRTLDDAAKIEVQFAVTSEPVENVSIPS